MKRELIVVGAALCLLSSGSAAAWSNHFLITWPALAAEPSVAGAKPVYVETLEDFLITNIDGLTSVLASEQEWAEKNVPTWPKLPGDLVFRDPKDDEFIHNIRVHFLWAIRANPRAQQSLYLQIRPGSLPDPGLAFVAEPTYVPEGMIAPRERIFEGLSSGDHASPLAVVATASDEPDYGLDVGLFEDNGTVFGQHAGLGAQSVGNPKLSYGSQAPFHMGFFHESGSIYTAAGFLRRMYPEQRIHLYLSLARYAFSVQHDYWGWRFLGWALHYVEDLGQPYHARLLPGKGSAGTIWNYLLSMVGISGPKRSMVVLATNGHLVLENIELQALWGAYRRGETNHLLLAALGDSSVDAGRPAWSDRYPRDVLTVESFAHADTVRACMLSDLPARFVDDPSYEYSITEADADMLAVLDASPERRADLMAELARLLSATGSHVRKAVRSVTCSK